jgi:hypothetical protein
MHAGRYRRTAALLAVTGSALLIAAGCGSDSDSSSSSDSKDTKTTSTMSDSSSSDSMTASDTTISSPGVDLRLTLDRLLGEHAALALVALDKTIAGEQDAQATVDALGANTDDLAAAIGSVYGDDAAEAFKSQWTAHIGMFVKYATGVAKKDPAMKAAAAKDLAGYQASFAKFLSTAAGLDANAASAALGMHVKQLEASMDAFGAGDYPKAYATAREAYAHMFGTGDALAAAISRQMPDKFGTGAVGSGTADTRVLLDQQLGEHAFLATVALTKTMAGAKDAGAAVKALDGNTVDLGKTIGSVYGKDAQEAFLAQWRAHIGFFVEYATGLAKNDDKLKQKGADDLGGYSEGFAKFLATATGGDKAAFKSALEEHVMQLTGALDDADSGDAGKAWMGERTAYEHMFGTGDAILTAIVQQNPDKFPAAKDPNSSDAGTAGGGDSDSMNG